MPERRMPMLPPKGSNPTFPSNEGRIRGAALRALRSRAQKLEPIIKVGRSGMSPALTASLEQALADHELVKVRFMDHKDERQMLSDELARQTRSQLVCIVGHVAVFYRKSQPAAATSAGGARGAVADADDLDE